MSILEKLYVVTPIWVKVLWLKFDMLCQLSHVV